MKCYKDIFNKDIYRNKVGFFIIIILTAITIFWIFIYYYKYRFKIKKYVLGITDRFVAFLLKEKKDNLINSYLKYDPPKNKNSEFNPASADKIILSKNKIKNIPKISIKKRIQL